MYTKFPVKENQKVWIEIVFPEASKDALQDYTELFKMVFSDSKIGKANITQLIVNENYFNQKLRDDLILFLQRSDNTDCTATRPANVSPKSAEANFVQS